MLSDEHLDIATFNDLKDVMAEDFSLLVQTYFSDSEQRLETLQKSLYQQKAEEVRQVAHALKGSSANIGATKLVNLLKELEAYSRESNLTSAEFLWLEVKKEYPLVKQAINQCL